MTREEIYASIYTHEEIYRPPQEDSSACLEVALGCSWGKCKFCDFAKDKFQIHSMSKIEWNLRMLGRLEPEKTRLFFLGENAFVLSFEQLSKIIEMTHTFMPNIRDFRCMPALMTSCAKHRKNSKNCGKWGSAIFTSV